MGTWRWWENSYRTWLGQLPIAYLPFYWNFFMLENSEFRVNGAFIILQNSVAWRKEFRADSILEEDLKFDENIDLVTFMHCFYKVGHPLCYNSYGIFSREGSLSEDIWRWWEPGEFSKVEGPNSGEGHQTLWLESWWCQGHDSNHRS